MWNRFHCTTLLLPCQEPILLVTVRRLVEIGVE
jgi:hypothetical protein